MSQIVTLELPDNLAHASKEVAERTQRPVEEVLLEWLNQAAATLVTV